MVWALLLGTAAMTSALLHLLRQRALCIEFHCVAALHGLPYHLLHMLRSLPGRCQRVIGVGLCALDADARPVYDERFAKELAGCGWFVAAMTPKKLAEHIGKIIA